MNRTLAIRRLWWKELRQLMPLVGLLVLMGVLLQVLAVLLPLGNQLPWREAAALLGMPGLFAAGVGALLIGQEKEARTLDWLRGLPLAASDLVRTKLFVALLGLLIVWSVSLALGWSTGAWEVVRDGRGGELIWPLHSVFLLLVGFATAWQFRSSMMALLLVVPLACLPQLFAGMHQSILTWNSSLVSLTEEPAPWLMVLYLILFSGGFAWYGWRAGLKYLAPHAAPKSSMASQRAVAANYRSPLDYASIAPAPALLWQFIMQNRSGLLGTTVLLVSSLLLPPPLGLFGLLAISWLGVLVFLGDAQQRRVHFLADRGVSPRLVWLTRQAVPLSILILILLLFWLIGLPWIPEIKQRLLDSITFALFAAVVLGVYWAAQWQGQMTTSPIVSAITAPLLASMFVGYLVYCAIELEASWWSIVTALFVPVVATWLGTRDWMDRRYDRWMWSRHALLGGVFLLLPLTSILSYWVGHSGMSSTARRELQLIAQQSSIIYGGPRELFAMEAKYFTDALLGDNEGWKLKREGIRLGLSQDSGAVASSNAHITCIAAALSARLSDQGADQSSMNDRLVDDYREWLMLLLDIHDRLRLSWRIIEQDQADAIEMWVVEELRAAGAGERLGSELLERINLVFSNVSKRDFARRQAIALSWQNARDSQLGGYQLNHGSSGYVTTKQVWEAGRRAGVVSELLLKSLDANQSELVDSRREIAHMLGYDSSANQEKVVKNAQGDEELLYYETLVNSIPGAFWNGPWEAEGAKLVRELF